VHWRRRIPQSDNSKDRLALYLGIELEVEQEDSNNGYNFLNHLKKIGLHKLYSVSDECSLDTLDGLELKTIPFKPHYFDKLQLKQVCELLKQYNFYISKHCGLHIHVNRNYLSLRGINILCKLIYLELPKTFKKLSRRKVFDWCNFSYFHINTLGEFVTIKESALYITSRTIEFRFFQGTLDYNTIKDCVDTVLLCIRWAKLLERRRVLPDLSEHFLTYVSQSKVPVSKKICRLVRR